MKQKTYITNVEITPNKNVLSKYYSFGFHINEKKYKICVLYKKFLDFCSIRVYFFLEILLKDDDFISTLDKHFK